MKGIILAGGKGTRLFPLTHGISKQLLPVYKQPMIYYPLKTLIDMDIKDILIIVASLKQFELFEKYIGDGSKFGVNVEYIVQENPNGLAEAFIIGEEFIGDDEVTLILGDNVLLGKLPENIHPNTIFTYKVTEPSAYGVALLDESTGKLVSIVEKPKEFISNDAVIGLYVFSNRAVEYAKKVKPSPRGELEITDLIELLNDDDLEGVNVQEFDGVWFDCGTHDDLLECAEFVRALDKRTTDAIFLEEI